MKRSFLFPPAKAQKIISRRLGLTGRINGHTAYNTDAPPVKTPEQERAELLSAIQSKVSDVLNTRGLVNKTEVEALLTERFKALDGVDPVALRNYQTELENLNKVLTEQGKALTGMQEKVENRQTQARRTTADQIRAYIEKNKQAFDDFRNRKVNSFGSDGNGSLIELETRVAATMTVGGSTGTSAFVPTVVVEPGLVGIASNVPFIEGYANTKPTNSARIVWVEKYNRQGNAAFIGEGVTKPLISFEIRTMESFAKKVADKIKVSTEMLEDVDFIAAEIEAELKYKVDIAVDAALITGAGDGTMTATDLKGLDAYVGGYALTTVETTDPNNFDAIRAAIAQVVSMNFNPSVVFYNPIDGANMDIVKDANGRPLAKEYKDANGRIYRIQPVETNQIAVGAFLLGDMSRFKVWNYKPFSVSYGWVNDDFEKNLVTVIGERRVHAYVAANDVGAFVYDTFANVKTAIAAA